MYIDQCVWNILPCWHLSTYIKGYKYNTYPCAPPCTNSEEKEEVTESLQDPREEETR